jgi:transposase-like protein
MWYVTSQKNGASALGLQRVLGLRSYQTAWAWLHKLRRAMVRPGRDHLSGWVEVDETYVGGWEEGMKGRRRGEKSLIVIAAQAEGNAIGRIRMRVIPDASAASLHPFVEDSVEPGSTLHTDGWQGYAGIDKKGYHREVSLIRGRPQEASKLLPRVHRVAALLKRWLLGTHQGAVEPQHLAYYLENSRSGSIAETPRVAASCFTASCSRPSPLDRPPTRRWWHQNGPRNEHNL